jgi:putative ABC transport system ATP-binding protein
VVSDVLVAEGLSRSYIVAGQQLPVVRRATFRIARNELVAILGRSGSGKSTLLSLCGGLDTPDTGWVVVDGTDVTQLSDEQRRAFLQNTVGWVFQTPQLVPLLSAAENVALAMRIAGQPQVDAMRMTATALEAVALEDRAELRADQLSRGERQRVALARALVKARHPHGGRDPDPAARRRAERRGRAVYDARRGGGRAGGSDAPDGGWRPAGGLIFQERNAAFVPLRSSSQPRTTHL